MKNSMVEKILIISNMSTFDKIKEIFYSGSFAFTGEQESINEIAFLVDKKYLTITEITISTKQDYLSVLRDTANRLKGEKIRAAGGSPEHIALKLSAGIYLKNIRNQDCLYEHNFFGYFPDVMTVNKKIIVECGHTQNPNKLFEYFKQDISECIQIPYASEESTEIKGYSFCAGNELKEFLNDLEKSKRSLIREIIFKKRT